MFVSMAVVETVSSSWVGCKLSLCSGYITIGVDRSMGISSRRRQAVLCCRNSAKAKDDGIRNGRSSKLLSSQNVQYTPITCSCSCSSAQNPSDQITYSQDLVCCTLRDPRRHYPTSNLPSPPKKSPIRNLHILIVPSTSHHVIPHLHPQHSLPAVRTYFPSLHTHDQTCNSRPPSTTTLWSPPAPNGTKPASKARPHASRIQL